MSVHDCYLRANHTARLMSNSRNPARITEGYVTFEADCTGKRHGVSFLLHLEGTDQRELEAMLAAFRAFECAWEGLKR